MNNVGKQQPLVSTRRQQDHYTTQKWKDKQILNLFLGKNIHPTQSTKYVWENIHIQNVNVLFTGQIMNENHRKNTTQWVNHSGSTLDWEVMLLSLRE